MPWLNEQRTRNAKVIRHDTDPNRYRVSASLAKLHYESNLGSGNFDTEVDMTPERVTNAALNGWRITGNSYHFAYQGFNANLNQRPRGTIAYGGRKGEHWLTMRPFRIGFLHWPARDFTAVGGAPTFNTPTIEAKDKVLGIVDDDPISWNIRNQLDVSLGNLWTVGSGSVEWLIKASGGILKQDFVINQVARDAITQWWNNNGTTPATETAFGIVYEVDLTDIPNVTNDGRDIGNDAEITTRLRLKNALGDMLGRFQSGTIFVRGRGGSVAVRKRLYRIGGQWYLFIGANVAQMNQNLLPGDLVIDPPIAEEDIGANSDDAQQGNPGSQANMLLSGYSSTNLDYLGDYSSQYHCGWRFTSVPIDQGSTITTATLEPNQGSAVSGGAISATLYGVDEDNTGTFTTAASNITGRTRTTASTALTSTTDFPGSGARRSWNVQAIVEEIVGRGGWASNNALAFVAITTSNNNSYTGFSDYNGGAANACDFNADVSAGGGGGRIMSSLAGPGGLAGIGGIAGQGGGLAG